MNHHSHYNLMITHSKSAHHNHPLLHHSLLLPRFNLEAPPLPCPISHLHFDCYFYNDHLLNLSFEAGGFQAT
jgi:hypothetical protein